MSTARACTLCAASAARPRAPGAATLAPPAPRALASWVCGRARAERRVRGAAVVCRASAAGHGAFDAANYFEACVENVKETQKYGHVINLRLNDGSRSILPLYVGDFECAALLKELNKRPSKRPLTHDLLKNSVESLGFTVTRVCLDTLVGQTFHASVEYAPMFPAFQMGRPVLVDARPSDAINLAVRFGAPIYIRRDIARQMAYVPSPSMVQGKETQQDVVESIREEMLYHSDPTVLVKLELQLAIANEDYARAGELRDRMDRMLMNNYELGMLVAMETAMLDQRYDEACYFRDELRRMRESQPGLIPKWGTWGRRGPETGPKSQAELSSGGGAQEQDSH